MWCIHIRTIIRQYYNILNSVSFLAEGETNYFSNPCPSVLICVQIIFIARVQILVQVCQKDQKLLSDFLPPYLIQMPAIFSVIRHHGVICFPVHGKGAPAAIRIG